MEIKKNVIVSVITQIILVVAGLVVPRIMIKYYGSDINGLLGTIAQIFAYIALLEGGIAQATRNVLLKLIADKNESGISKVMSVSQLYFRRMAKIYAIIVFVVAFVFSKIIITEVNDTYIFIFFIVEGLSGFFSFYFVEHIFSYLTIIGKGYVCNIFNPVSRILGYITKCICACLGLNILYISIVFLFINIIRIICCRIYFKRRYGWINCNKKCNDYYLKDKNSYLVTEIASTIFLSTDMIVISTILSTKISSVYNIYNIVFFNINSLMNTVYFSVYYVLGKYFFNDKEHYCKVHDAFCSVFLGAMTSMMVVCNFMTIPFVKIYTSGINDINYIYPQIPLIFCLINILSWSRYVSGNLTGISGYAKQTSRISIIEAVLNIFLSIILAYKLGLVGVLLATCIALPVKIIWCMYISDKKVLNRSYKNTLSIYAVNIAFFIVATLINQKYPIEVCSITEFCLYTFCIFIISMIIGFIINLLINPEIINIIKSIRKKAA